MKQKKFIMLIIVVISTILSGCTVYTNGGPVNTYSKSATGDAAIELAKADRDMVRGILGKDQQTILTKKYPGTLVIENEGTEVVENSSTTTTIQEILVPTNSTTQVIEIPATSSGSYIHKEEKFKVKVKPSKTKIKYDGSVSAGSGPVYHYDKNKDTVSKFE